MSHEITLQQAIDMTKRYRNNVQKVINPSFVKSLTLSETFDRSIFDKILAQSNCAGIRIYFGMDTDLKVHCILVRVNSQNHDILPTSIITDASTNDGTIGEESSICPPDCPPQSPLNS